MKNSLLATFMHERIQHARTHKLGTHFTFGETGPEQTDELSNPPMLTPLFTTTFTRDTPKLLV